MNQKPIGWSVVAINDDFVILTALTDGLSCGENSTGQDVGS